MTSPTLLIPFALPPAEHAKDLIQLLQAEGNCDGLAMLLSRCASANQEQFDDFSLMLPHEIRLTGQQHPVMKLQDRLPTALPAGTWFILNPVHLHIASNHLVLTDYRQLEIQADEAQLLFAQAQDIIEESGLQLIYVDAGHWLLGANAWQGLQTASPDAACGHNIDIWSPQGDAARAWRRLQNEIQMVWFINPVQEQRMQRGAKAVNGLWLSGGLTVAEPIHRAQPTPTTVQAWLEAPTFIVLDELTASALAGDWGSWATALLALEQRWLKPVCAALKSGQLPALELVLSNSNRLLTVRSTTMSLRKFWRRPQLRGLLP